MNPVAKTFFIVFLSRFLKKFEHGWKALVHDGVSDSFDCFVVVAVAVAAVIVVAIVVIELYCCCCVCVYCHCCRKQSRVPKSR